MPSAPLGAVLADWGVTNVTTVDLGVDPAIFHPSDDPADSARAALKLPTGTTLLLYVGRLSPEKNTQTLFAGFHRLCRRHPGKFHLLVVGDGNQRKLVAPLQKKTGAVTWQPYCSDPRELARLYRAADLFVHPGVQETFGLVTLESQACGTPVVGIPRQLHGPHRVQRPRPLGGGEPARIARRRHRGHEPPGPARHRAAQQRHRGCAVQLARACSTGCLGCTDRSSPGSTGDDDALPVVGRPARLPRDGTMIPAERIDGCNWQLKCHHAADGGPPYKLQRAKPNRKTPSPPVPFAAIAQRRPSPVVRSFPMSQAPSGDLLPPPFVIRQYRASDRDRVRWLCCETGFLGQPIDPVFEDRELFADFLTNYYLNREPESAFVIEVGGEVRGYLLGCRLPLRNQVP